MDELILFGNGELTAANGDTRILEGKIVAFNVEGNTSAGKTVFAPGSIKCSDITKIKLNDEHVNSAPVGRMISMRETSDGIYASFKISKSARGNDALILASEGLKTGFSVGVINSKYERMNDGILVTSSELQHVGHVEAPAIATSEITRVAASQNAETTPTTESEAPVTTAPAETTEVAPPEVAPETVEASQVNASVTRPVAPSGIQVVGVRSPIKTHANYLQHKIAASLGNSDSAEYVRAADGYAAKITAANDSFTTNPAFSPVSYAPGVIDATVYRDRPTIEACGGTLALPSTGMTISHPKITTAGTMAVVSEGGSTTSTQIVSSYVDATVVKIAGQQIMSVELLERSGPAFYDAMFNNISKAYDRAANAAVIAEIVSGGTQAATQAGTLAGLQAYTALAGPAVYAGSKEMPTAFIGGTSVWSLLINAQDSTGRNLFNALNPQNASGTSSPKSLKGNFMGLDLWIDSGMVATTIDDCAFIVNPSSIAIYESPKLTMSVNVIATGEVNVMLYGFFAVKTLIATGLQRYNLT